MSMVVAQFEETFSEYKSMLNLHRQVNEYVANVLSFLMITYNEPIIEDQECPGDYGKACNKKQMELFLTDTQLLWSGGQLDFDYKAQVEPLLLFGGQQFDGAQNKWFVPRDLNDANAQAIKALVLLVSGKDTYHITWMEFATALTTLKAMETVRTSVLDAAEFIFAKFLKAEEVAQNRVNTNEGADPMCESVLKETQRRLLAVCLHCDLRHCIS